MEWNWRFFWTLQGLGSRSQVPSPKSQVPSPKSQGTRITDHGSQSRGTRDSDLRRILNADALLRRNLQQEMHVIHRDVHAEQPIAELPLHLVDKCPEVFRDWRTIWSRRAHGIDSNGRYCPKLGNSCLDCSVPLKTSPSACFLNIHSPCKISEKYSENNR